MSKFIYLEPEQLKPELMPLCGHIDPETAYIQSDYPSGRYRVRRRVWIETKKGHGMRVMAQTAKGRYSGEVWGKPYGDIYCPYVCLLHDSGSDHVYIYKLQVRYDGGSIQRFQAFWSLFYSRLDEANQQQVDRIGTTIAETANQSKHCFREGTQPPTITPRIDADVDLVYNPQQGGLLSYVFAQLVKGTAEAEVDLDDLTQVKVVSAQAHSRKGVLYDLLDYYRLADQVIAAARQVARWEVTEYSQDHWCYAVLKGYRGFEWDGEPINNSVQRLFALKQSMATGTAPSEADLNASFKLSEYVWDAAAAYWRQQKQAEAPSPSVEAVYEISHATCQN